MEPILHKYLENNKRSIINMALLSAVKEENIDDIKQLISEGAYLETYHPNDTSRSTPLTIAVLTGNTEIIKLLIESGAKVNPTESSRTPLTSAMSTFLSQPNMSSEKRIENFNILISNGAYINGNPEEHCKFYIPLIYALNLYRTGGADKTTLEFIRVLLEHGADVNLKSFCMYTSPTFLTPLQFAKTHLKDKQDIDIIGLLKSYDRANNRYKKCQIM